MAEVEYSGPRASGEVSLDAASAKPVSVTLWEAGQPRAVEAFEGESLMLALKRAGLQVKDLDVIESNEAFAAQACAVSRELGFDRAKVNPYGSGISLGHPIGATGAIILTKLVHELRRINGRYGLATMCIGGGQGIAAIIENMR